MELTDIVAAEAVAVDVAVASKRQTLQEAADRLADLTGADAAEIFAVLMAREKLGSTGVGHGVAMPHGKLADLDRLVCVLMRLAEPVDFEAPDDEPVDLVAVLLAPEGGGAEHLKALSKCSRVLRDAGAREVMRAAPTPGQLRAAFCGGLSAQDAA